MNRGIIKAFVLPLASAGLIFGFASGGFGQNFSGGKNTATYVSESSRGTRETSGTVEEVPPMTAGEESIAFGDWDLGLKNRLYFNAEYLLWWFKNSPVPPPLVSTTSDSTFIPLGALSDPNSSVILGNHNINTGVHQGARFTAGMWIDNRREIGVEGSYFFLVNKTKTQIVSSGGQPGSAILAVPFFDEDGISENAFVLASPGNSAGAAILSLTSRLQGAEIQGVIQTCEGDGFHVEVLGGLRYLNLTETLTFASFSTGLSDPNTGLILNTSDGFGTRNLFYGVQLGARGGYQWGDFEFGATAKLAIGNMLERVNNTGFATTNFFNAPAGGPFAGVPTQAQSGVGTFVQPTNVGRISRDRFAVAPDFAVNVAYQISDSLRVFVGYEFLYLSTVLRPGNQIDRGINVSQTLQNNIAGNASAPGVQPAMTFATSDFWAQGINLGMEFRY